MEEVFGHGLAGDFSESGQGGSEIYCDEVVGQALSQGAFSRGKGELPQIPGPPCAERWTPVPHPTPNSCRLSATSTILSLSSSRPSPVIMEARTAPDVEQRRGR